jgi:hypothetical protein
MSFVSQPKLSTTDRLGIGRVDDPGDPVRALAYSPDADPDRQSGGKIPRTDRNRCAQATMVVATSRRSPPKNAVTVSRSATVMPTWSKRSRGVRIRLAGELVTKQFADRAPRQPIHECDR